MQTPRLERFGPHRLIGVVRHYCAIQDIQILYSAMHSQWDEFLRLHPPSSVDGFGVCGHMPDGVTHIEYFCGIPFEGALPAGFSELFLPPMLCAVFHFDGHAGQLNAFVHEIFRHRLPAAGLSLLPAQVGAPEFIERYFESFSGATLDGGIEVLIPVIS